MAWKEKEDQRQRLYPGTGGGGGGGEDGQDAAEGGGQQQTRVVLNREGPDRPLGATIRKDGDQLVIGRVVRNSACDGQLNAGDVLVSVNGVSLDGCEVAEAIELLKRATGAVVLYILPSRSPPAPTSEVRMVLRALFKYDPQKDILIPCKELGLSFQPGDIIHVVCQDDPSWWQGSLEGTADGLHRIFPSPMFQRENVPDQYKGRPFYERQTRLLPQPQRPRPLVLVSAPCCGCHELRFLLINSDPERFAGAVTHTTRRREPGEEDEDYCFVNRNEFQRLKLQGAFLETAKVGNDFYGTAVSSVQAVTNAGKVCVLALQPCSLRTCNAAACSLQAIRSHQAKLMPHIVFVSQPGAAQLRGWHAKLATECQQAYSYKDRDLESIAELGRCMLDSHRAIVDSMLQPEDPQAAVNQLTELTLRVEREPQWVPESWLRPGPARKDDPADTESSS